MSGDRVVLYGTAWCEITRGLRIWLNRKGVAYQFHNVDVDASDRASALAFDAGRYQVPVVVVGERVLRNPQLSVLERELMRQELLP